MLLVKLMGLLHMQRIQIKAKKQGNETISYMKACRFYFFFQNLLITVRAPDATLLMELPYEHQTPATHLTTFPKQSFNQALLSKRKSHGMNIGSHSCWETVTWQTQNHEHGGCVGSAGWAHPSPALPGGPSNLSQSMPPSTEIRIWGSDLG